MSLKQGETAQAKFLYEAMLRGLVVVTPFNTVGYDYVVENERAFNRLQIKSVSYQQRLKNSDNKTYRLIIGKGSKTKVRYTKNDVDIIGCYVIPEDMWYFIPVEVIEAIYVSLYPHRELDKRANNSCGKYEEYKDGWKIFAPVV